MYKFVKVMLQLFLAMWMVGICSPWYVRERVAPYDGSGVERRNGRQGGYDCHRHQVSECTGKDRDVVEDPFLYLKIGRQEIDYTKEEFEELSRSSATKENFSILENISLFFSPRGLNVLPVANAWRARSGAFRSAERPMVAQQKQKRMGGAIAFP